MVFGVLKEEFLGSAEVAAGLSNLVGPLFGYVALLIAELFEKR